MQTGQTFCGINTDNVKYLVKRMFTPYLGAIILLQDMWYRFFFILSRVEEIKDILGSFARRTPGNRQANRNFTLNHYQFLKPNKGLSYLLQLIRFIKTPSAFKTHNQRVGLS